MEEQIITLIGIILGTLSGLITVSMRPYIPHITNKDDEIEEGLKQAELKEKQLDRLFENYHNKTYQLVDIEYSPQVPSIEDYKVTVL